MKYINHFVRLLIFQRKSISRNEIWLFITYKSVKFNEKIWFKLYMIYGEVRAEDS